MEIAGKLADALSMFWQSLDERERRLLTIGAAYVVAVVFLAPVERQRRERERAEIADRIAAHLKEGSRA